MAEVKKYFLPPTALIPNSPRPLLHYPGFFKAGPDFDACKAYDEFTKNGWQVQWIFRYGSTQKSHYHSQVHECMTVLTGSATIRFGVADTDADMEENTHGSGKENGGVEVEAHAGDVFVIPAGVAHKTFDTSPVAEFKLLTPGQGHGIAADDAREALSRIDLSGFTMLGAYPTDGSNWDFVERDEDHSKWQETWSVPRPELDPVLGDSSTGICGQWPQ